MRNREAARYARWAATTAGLIAVAVVGIYAERALRQARARRSAPAAVPITVEQQSAQFSFSKVEQDRTLFTIRASRATQYKDQNLSLLEDVWITVYGRDGSRNDNIHTRECSYQPLSGNIRCEGDVQINIQNANPAAVKSGGLLKDSLEVKTSNLSFNRNTGEASTPAPVEFIFPQGHGHGVGASYSTRDSIVRVEHGVEFDLDSSTQTGRIPVSATGSSLEIHRDERTVLLKGPALIRQGARELSSDTISVELDSDYHPRHVVASGHPQIRATDGVAKLIVSASQFEGFLNPAGWVERVLADGGVTGTRDAPAGADRFSAAQVEIAMLPGRNLMNEMTAKGAVVAESHQGPDSRVLKTEALRVTFSAPGPRPVRADAPKQMVDQQRIESAETLSPATIESKTGSDSTTLSAKKFVAQFGAAGHLDKLFGHSGVEIHQQTGNAAPQVISAAELTATLDPRGEWETLDESGNVRFQQADRQATADRAKVVQSADTITLDGSLVVSDSMSRTTAEHAVVDRKSGELHATGGVVSTYISAASGDTLSLGSGAAHISADALSGSLNAGHVTYAGHARLWQGESVLDSDQIELWRDDKKMQATGRVVAVFAQVRGPLASLPGKSFASPSPASAPSSAPAGPSLWKVHAPALTYWSDQGKAHLEGGVTADSTDGSLDSRTLDVFLAAPPANAAAGQAAAANPKRASELAGAPGGRELSRILAQGNVIVRQGDRRGMADQAEYTAADGKFVLSGGQPTIADASSDTTTGHSLTFFVANDTILIDSQEGSRTLTRHRVEK